MIRHPDTDKRQLHQLIRSGKVVLGGNRKLKIYGKLSCKSGKRMLPKNRVFFTSESEAIHEGHRPCGHCMREAYREWKTAKSAPSGQTG